MLEAQEEVKAIQQRQTNPFAALQQDFSGDYEGQVYSRYEIASAWKSSIKARIANEHDIAFSVALNETVLEVGDMKATPFPIALTYVSDATSRSLGLQQMEERPDYVERLKHILEESLQTPVDLTLRSRTLNDSERKILKQAQMSPYELDLETDLGLQKLKELFAAELIHTIKGKRPSAEPQQGDSGDIDGDQDN